MGEVSCACPETLSSRHPMLCPDSVVVWYQSLDDDVWSVYADSSWLKMNLSMRWLNEPGVCCACSSTYRYVASFANLPVHSVKDYRDSTLSKG